MTVDADNRGMNMNVEQQKITKLVISDVENHDPIHVYLEDEGDNRRGRVTISEFGKSWSCSWGGMGMPLTEFLLWIMTVRNVELACAEVVR